MTLKPRTVMVIGAGIVGMSCAHFLRRDGHEVLVLDPRDPGDGASFGNAGILAYGAVAPVAMPGILRRVPRMLLDPHGPLVIRWRYLPQIAPWLWHFVRASRPSRSEVISQALAALLARADEAYRSLLHHAGAADLVRHHGWLKAYVTEKAFAATSAERALMTRRGIRFEILDADEVRQLEPALAPIFHQGLFQPDCAMVLSPKRLVETLVVDFLQRGGRIERAAAMAVIADPGSKTVVSNQGQHRADVVVLAAGAWSRRLAQSLGARMPLDTERGYHLMLRPPETGLRRPVVWGDHSFGLVPMEHGVRLTSGVELAGLDAPPNYTRVERMLALAQRMLPGVGEPMSRWLGFRPSLPDSLPVLGRAPRDRDIYFAFGHQHLGLTLGAVTGRIIADLVAGRDPGLDLAPYRPERW